MILIGRKDPMPAENEFPDDVWDAAVKARSSVSEEYFRDHAAIVIARAILAERNKWVGAKEKHPHD
jgi:hypothetical protein